MPGLAPFLDALSLPAHCCTNCGFWQRHFETPSGCPICADSRHVMPARGWRFVAPDEAAAAWPMHFEEIEDGVLHLWNDPVDGIGSHSYLLRTGHGNVVFEGATIFSAEALDEIAAWGGIDVLAASHPHTYGALWQLQDRFEPELVLHPGDFEWTAALRVTWPFDTRIEVLPGIHLVHTGVHFAGHSVLLDEPRGLLMCGDALKFELDRADPGRAAAVSAHKSFPRSVPLTVAEMHHYRDVFTALPFHRTFSPFEQVTNFGTAQAQAFFDRQIAGGRPTARPILHGELGS